LTGTANASPTTVELYTDGNLLHTETFNPGIKNNERVSFIVPGNNKYDIEIHLKSEKIDALASDNTAYLHLPVLRPLRIYIPVSLHSVRAAMKGIEGVTVFPAKKSDLPKSNNYDLIITDNKADMEKDSLVIFTNGFVPDYIKHVVKIKKTPTTLTDWNREDKLLRNMELGELVLIEEAHFLPGKNKKDLQNLGNEIEMYGKDGPLLLRNEWNDRLAYHMMFHINNSSLPYRIAFPIMIKNLVEITRMQAGLADLTADRTGILKELRLLPDRTFRITSPAGKVIVEKSNSAGILSGTSAERAGKYTISSKNMNDIFLGVSLLSKEETLLSGTDKIVFNELTVEVKKQQIKTARSLWKYLSIIALFFLLGEWLFFNKRS